MPNRTVSMAAIGILTYACCSILQTQGPRIAGQKNIDYIYPLATNLMYISIAGIAKALSNLTVYCSKRSLHAVRMRQQYGMYGTQESRPSPKSTFIPLLFVSIMTMCVYQTACSGLYQTYLDSTDNMFAKEPPFNLFDFSSMAIAILVCAALACYFVCEAEEARQQISPETQSLLDVSIRSYSR